MSGASGSPVGVVASASSSRNLRRIRKRAISDLNVKVHLSQAQHRIRIKQQQQQQHYRNAQTGNDEVCEMDMDTEMKQSDGVAYVDDKGKKKDKESDEQTENTADIVGDGNTSKVNAETAQEQTTNDCASTFPLFDFTRIQSTHTHALSASANTSSASMSTSSRSGRASGSGIGIIFQMAADEKIVFYGSVAVKVHIGVLNIGGLTLTAAHSKFLSVHSPKHVQHALLSLCSKSLQTVVEIRPAEKRQRYAIGNANGRGAIPATESQKTDDYMKALSEMTLQVSGFYPLPNKDHPAYQHISQHFSAIQIPKSWTAAAEEIIHTLIQRRSAISPAMQSTTSAPSSNHFTSLSFSSSSSSPASASASDCSSAVSVSSSISCCALPFAVLTCGGRNSGKSTFTRYLCNRLLSEYTHVAWLETDVGQSEFTPSGCVSLHIISMESLNESPPNISAQAGANGAHADTSADARKVSNLPLSEPPLGPPFTHLSPPVLSYFFGDATAASDPSGYLSLVARCIQFYRQTLCTSSTIGSDLPLLINTHGWVKSAGLDILNKLIQIILPAQIVELKATNSHKPLKPLFSVDYSPRIYRLPRFGDSKSQSTVGASAERLRSLALMEYFLPADYSLLSAYTLSNSCFAQYLCSFPPIRLHISEWQIHLSQENLHQLTAVYILQILNAAIVAFHQPNLAHMHELPCTKVSYRCAAAAETIELSVVNGCKNVADYGFSFRGLGIIRGIDAARGFIYVLTPLPIHQLNTCTILSHSIQMALPFHAFTHAQPQLHAHSDASCGSPSASDCLINSTSTLSGFGMAPYVSPWNEGQGVAKSLANTADGFAVEKVLGAHENKLRSNLRRKRLESNKSK